jgi:hypothetical protein
MEYFEQNPSAKELQDDRIKFKIYWAEKHLQNLKDYQKIEEINSSFETRVKWEHDVECLLFFMIGAKDAFLVRICDKLGLPIDEDKRADIDLINTELTCRCKKKILEYLNKLRSQPNNWFWDMNRNRVIGTHLAIINIHMPRHIGGGEDEDITTLRVQSDRSLGAVPYLEKCLGQMKDLILHTIDQDPQLK